MELLGHENGIETDIKMQKNKEVGLCTSGGFRNRQKGLSETTMLVEMVDCTPCP